MGHKVRGLTAAPKLRTDQLQFKSTIVTNFGWLAHTPAVFFLLEMISTNNL